MREEKTVEAIPQPSTNPATPVTCHARHRPRLACHSPSTPSSTTHMSKQFQFKLVLLGQSLHLPRSYYSLSFRRVRSRKVQVVHSPSFPACCSLCPSLVLRFVKDQFDDYRESTIGGQSNSQPKAIPPLTGLSAAFLTQTVTLDDQTTVKFEIWYPVPIPQTSNSRLTFPQGHRRTRTIQGVFPSYFRSMVIDSIFISSPWYAPGYITAPFDVI